MTRCEYITHEVQKKLKHCALHVEVTRFQPNRMPLTYGNNCTVFSLNIRKFHRKYLKLSKLVMLIFQFWNHLQRYLISAATQKLHVANTTRPFFDGTPLFDVEYLRNGVREPVVTTLCSNQFLGILTSLSRADIRVIQQNFQLSKIFNDAEDRAVSLRQLSFLSTIR